LDTWPKILELLPPRELQWNNNSHRQESQRIWVRKKNEYNNEECALSLQAQHKKRGWYVENGCSKHMIGDKDRFLTLKKEKYGSVAFGNHNTTRNVGRGTFKIGSKDDKEKKVLLVEDIKHNILSVSQMCDHGQKIVFDSQKIKIRKSDSGRVVLRS